MFQDLFLFVSAAEGFANYKSKCDLNHSNNVRADASSSVAVKVASKITDLTSAEMNSNISNAIASDSFGFPLKIFTKVINEMFIFLLSCVLLV